MSKMLKCEDRSRKSCSITDINLKVPKNPIICNTFLFIPTFNCHPSVQLQYFLTLKILHYFKILVCPAVTGYIRSWRHTFGHLTSQLRASKWLAWFFVEFTAQYSRMNGQSRSVYGGQGRIRPLSGVKFCFVQPIASHCMDCNIVPRICPKYVAKL